MTVHTWSDNERLYAADLNSSFASVVALGGARVRRTAAQTITTSSLTPIAFDVEDFDYGGYHSNVTNNTRLTVPVAGLYAFGATIQWTSDATGFRLVTITQSGGPVDISQGSMMAVNGAVTVQTISGIQFFNASDYITCSVYHTKGSNLNVDLAGAYSPCFWIAPLRGT